jgi:hypothetical protein
MSHHRCLLSMVAEFLDQAGEMGAHGTIIDARAGASESV